MGTAAVLARAVTAQPLRWLGLAAGFLGLYHLALLGAMLLRFGTLPNYVVWHDVWANYGHILAGTPSWTDRIPLMLAEPWFETGFRNPAFYNIAEWSFLVMPGKFLLMAGVSALLATFVRLRAARRACTARFGTAMAGGGALVIGIVGASLSWILCCGAPSWIVILAVLGLSVPLALALEPLGALLATAGFLLLALALLRQARAMARTQSRHQKELTV